MTAILAGVRRTVRFAMMFRDRLAPRAIDAVWIEGLNQPFEAGRIIRELPLEFHKRVEAFGSCGALGVVSIRLAHDLNVAHGSTSVKGILTIFS